FFLNDTATTEIYTLSLHDALPICGQRRGPFRSRGNPAAPNLPGGETHPPTASGNCTWRPKEGWHWRRASGWAADRGPVMPRRVPRYGWLERRFRERADRWSDHIL